MKFIYLLLLSILLYYLSYIILDIETLVTYSYSEKLTQQQLFEFIELQRKWQPLSYILLAPLLLIKVSIIATILDAGCFFFSKKIKFKKLFNIVVKAEFVFLLVIIFKIAWFYFFQTKYELEDVQYFYPLSALNIIGYKGLETWFIYPFQVLNLFELAYWFILAFLLGKELNENIEKGFSIVASSYGVSLLIWIVGVIFFTLNIS